MTNEYYTEPIKCQGKTLFYSLVYNLNVASKKI